MHNAGFGGWIVVIVIALALLTAAAIVLSKRANKAVGDELSKLRSKK